MARLPLPLALVGVLLLAGCASTVSLEAAPNSNDPDCAQVSVHLPDEIEGQAKQYTDAQATAAWGSPVSVILRCGMDVPAASPLPCFDKGGVFWLRDASTAPNYVFTTFGRDPAISVAVDADLMDPGIALETLTDTVLYTPENGRQCTSLEDTVTGSTPLPAG